MADGWLNNWVNILLVLVVAWNIVRGIQRGFVGSAIDLLEFILSLVVALSAYGPVGDVAAALTGIPALLARPLAFGALWLVTSIVVGLVGRLITLPISRFMRGTAVDIGLSLAPSTLKGIVTAAFIVAVLDAIPVAPPGLPGDSALVDVHDALVSSAISDALVQRASGFDRYVLDIMGQPVTQTLTALTVKPDSEEQVSLDFTEPNPGTDAQAEQQLFDLLNQARIQAGLQPLARDQTLDSVARSYSAQMLQDGYFGHNSPDGTTPFDRMRDDGVRFIEAGENLAFAPTATLAHEALMDSPGHRANILQPDFSRVGIGVATAPGHGRMFTEDFTS